MHQHIVAGPDPAPAKTGRNAQHALAKLPVRPGLALARERFPDQQGVISARFGAEV